MGTREIVAYAILLLLAVAGMAAIWLIATARKRQRRREQRDFDRSNARRAERENGEAG